MPEYIRKENTMIFTTTLNKHVICPLWKEEITICGKYRLSEEESRQYEAKFMYATCPIVENLKLPKTKQNKKYELFRFCNIESCELLNDFQPVIDTRKIHSR